MTTTLGAIIVAAGSGERMSGLDKLFTEVAGRPLLAHTIALFDDSPLVSAIVLVVSAANLGPARRLVSDQGFVKVAAVVQGGERRQDSVRAGLNALAECDFVAVHDGGRPLATAALIERGLAAALETGAAVPGIRIPDTVKEALDDDIVTRTVHRSRLWAIQTPQVFRRELLVRAHREITTTMTDDAAMVEALGEPVRVFEGDGRNVKVTVAEDLALMRSLITQPTNTANELSLGEKFA